MMMMLKSMREKKVSGSPCHSRTKIKLLLRVETECASHLAKV